VGNRYVQEFGPASLRFFIFRFYTFIYKYLKKLFVFLPGRQIFPKFGGTPGNNGAVSQQPAVTSSHALRLWRCLHIIDIIRAPLLASIAGSRKTVEGTAGGALATLVGWAALLAAAPSGGGAAFHAIVAPGAGWVALAGATAGACLLEAATTQLDNVFVPLHLFALLCLL